MEFPSYHKNIIISLILGMILGTIFDFFRAIRKCRKTDANLVLIQDIIYFVISFLIMCLSIYLFLDDDIRGYIVFSTASGVFIYFKFLSKYINKLYIIFIKRINTLLNFTFLPVKLFTLFCGKLFNFFRKIVKKCCIKIFNMITYLRSRLVMLPNIKQKKKVKYEE